MTKLTTLQKNINYQFKDTNLLITALTHKSITNETSKNNQRLEFLGDSILGSIISEYLYIKFPDYNDGELTVLKSLLVRKETLAKLGNHLSLSKYLIKIDAVENLTTSMLEDTIEAIIGAIFLDSNFDMVKNIVITLFEKYFIKQIMSKNLLVKKQSYIAELKEYSEKKYQSPPKTKLIGKAGKDNAPIFTMEIKVGDFIELGKGGSKKEALTDASKKILQRINIT